MLNHAEPGFSHGTCQAEFLDVARCNVEALNRALQEIPVEQVRVHVCWGNYAGPHHQERDAGPGVRGDVMKMMQEDDWKMIGIFQGVGGTFFVSEFDLSSEWGNIWQPHVQCGDPSVQDISAEHVWPLLGEVKAKYLLLEGANPRHRRDVQCFELAVQKGYFKGHQVCRCPNIPNWELVQVWRPLSSRTEQ